eukprot:GILK01003100.1.p2 GENE.GILK01003100.1~~GILK01003100.1.p2  ORF type:complete len:209 (+),score=42.50 GILK01003100.1:127-753(+)
MAEIGILRSISASPERRSEKAKEELERARVAQRTNTGLQVVKSPTGVDRHTALFMDDKDRFKTDAAADLREMELQRKIKREQMLEKKRAEHIAREEKRWNEVDAEHQRKAVQADAMLSRNKAKTNKSSVPYNPISGAYNDDADGMRLKYHDDVLKYRAQVRQVTLHTMMNRNLTNPITGASVSPMDKPPAPERPTLPSSDGKTYFERK